MMDFKKWIRKVLRAGSDRGRRATTSRPRRIRPRVEALEDRWMPAVVFDPHFAKESIIPPATANGQPRVLDNPTVYLIFWGSDWGGTVGALEAGLYDRAAQALLGPRGSAYFKGLSEYGNVGLPAYGGSWIDADPSDNPPAGFNPGDLTAVDSQTPPVSNATDAALEIQRAINAPGRHVLGPPSGGTLLQSPIYVLVTGPGHSAGTNGGYNASGTLANNAPVNMITLGTSGDFGPDFFSIALSHELAERITDPVGFGQGVEVSYPENFPAGLVNGSQIGDGEQEPAHSPHYEYSLGGSGGVLVQSYFSRSTLDSGHSPGAFVVPDGNAQSVFLDPIWNGDGVRSPFLFSGGYDLLIKGDQRPADRNDQVTVTADASGIGVDLNGENFYFGFTPTYRGLFHPIRNITIDTGGGANSVTLRDFGSLEITGTVTVRSTGGSCGLTVDDSGTAGTENVTVTGNSVTDKSGSGSATVNVGPGVTALTVRTGNFTAVDVQSTGPATTIYSNGLDTVSVGDGSDSPDFVRNLTVHGDGQTSVSVDDESNPVVYVHGVPYRTVSAAYTIDSGQFERRSVAVVQAVATPFVETFVTTVNYDHLGGLSVIGGQPVNASYRVDSTVGAGAVRIYSGTGAGADTIAVGDAGHNLDLVSFISVYGNGKTRLTLDDKAASAFGPEQVQYAVGVFGLDRTALRLNPGTSGPAVFSSSILYTGIAGLTLDGTDSGAQYTVSGTSVPTLLQGGSGNDTFRMAAAAASLSGALTVDGGGGVNTLDYSAYAGDVLVDLPSGTATGIAGGVARIQNVVGGRADSLLFGNGGNVLTGGIGRNLLFAGAKPSTLVGNAGEDVLVGGAVDFGGASRAIALGAFLTEWSRTDRGYAARVQDLLTGGGLNGQLLLNASTFRSNGGGNTLTGGGGVDLYYGLLPADSATPDRTDWNPASGAVFVDPESGQVPVGLDLTKLGGPALTLDGTQAVSTSGLGVFTLAPGSHRLVSSVGTGAVSFSVNADGTVGYDPALEGVLAGAGTATLRVNGAAVAVNATALSLPDLLLDYAIPEKSAAPFTVRLLPGNHVLEGAAGTGAAGFAVSADGSVGYDPALQGILGGAGTRALAVNGARVTIDARALEVTSLTADYTSYNSALVPLQVLPGRHLFSVPGSSTSLYFDVAFDGTISIPDSENGIVSVTNGRTLVVNRLW